MPGARRAALIVAVLLAALLGFTAYAKFFYPNLKPLVLNGAATTMSNSVIDRGTAGLEVVLLLMILALYRRWWLWLGAAVFFGGLAGYSCFKSWHGESCGCAGGLVEFPKYVMFGVDVVVAGVSLALAAGLGARRGAVIGALVLALMAGALGWQASSATTPPRRQEMAQKHEGKLAHDRLLASPLMQDIREQPAGGAAWLVFVHDPTCHICEAMKPTIDFKMAELAETLDPVLQVRTFSVPEMEKDERVRIETFAWETPTMFIVQDGRITKMWRGKELEEFKPDQFQAIYDTMESGGYPAEEAPGQGSDAVKK